MLSCVKRTWSCQFVIELFVLHAVVINLFLFIFIHTFNEYLWRFRWCFDTEPFIVRFISKQVRYTFRVGWLFNCWTIDRAGLCLFGMLQQLPFEFELFRFRTWAQHVAKTMYKTRIVVAQRQQKHTVKWFTAKLINRLFILSRGIYRTANSKKAWNEFLYFWM